jgi:acetyl esterase/lipase
MNEGVNIPPGDQISPRPRGTNSHWGDSPPGAKFTPGAIFTPRGKLVPQGVVKNWSLMPRQDPTTEKLLPVMFFVHGGAFYAGTQGSMLKKHFGRKVYGSIFILYSPYHYCG